MPSPCLILAPDFSIVTSNAAYRAATFIEENAVRGKNIFDVFPANPEDPSSTGTARLRASLERVLATKHADTMPLQRYDIPLPGGSFEVRHWSPVNVPVLDAYGEVVSIIHRVEDVTALIEKLPRGLIDAQTHALATELFQRGREIDSANALLREANASLEQLDKARTDFFNDVSHELRTPLTLLMWSLEQLQRSAASNGDQGQQKAVASARRNAGRMLRLVNSLLELARADSGHITATFQPTDLASFTAELANQFRTAVEQIGLKLRVNCEPLDQAVFVDHELWEKIVLNLLSNAVKFTSDGEIEVTLVEKEGRVHFSVRDTGSGIPDADIPKVFDRFYRARGAPSNGEQGTGIGLALVKEFARLHGGEVKLKSKLGAGSVFCVEIPLGRAHLPPAAIVEGEKESHPRRKNDHALEAQEWILEQEAVSLPFPDTSPSLQKRARVLVVDDNAELGHYIARLLGERFSTETATDGARALESIYERPPDVLVTDLLMAGMGGLDLVRAIRTDPLVSALPIILVSGKADDEQRSHALEAGADDFLVKPFSARELLARVSILVDQAERSRQERTLRAEAEAARMRMRMVLDSVSEAFIAVDRQWRITFANGRAASWLGTNDDALMQKPLSQFFPVNMEEALRSALQRTMARRESAQVELERGGRCWHVGIFPSPEGIVMLASDITERKEAESRFRHLAHHDALTGLPNRACLIEFGEKLLAATRRSRKMLAVLFIDLDRFKSINDSFGHGIGDQLLQQVAARLRSSSRAEDMVGRLAGDEFLAVLADLSEASDAGRAADHLLEELKKPYRVGERELYCAPSIGISLFPQDGQSLDALIQHADMAMYQAKEAGRNNFHFYTGAPTPLERRTLSIEQRLRRGVEGQGFQLVYQPIVDTHTGSVRGAEALLRWPQPDGDPIGPELFIPIAESVGVIQSLGRWVFGEVCKQVVQWQADGLPAITVAINVSPIQFRHQGFLPSLLNILRESGVNPGLISLELTESALIKDIDESVKTFSILREVGLSVALDDFGTGYSSLSQLARLPLDKLKIDRSFVKGIEGGGAGPPIVEAIIALGHTLNLEIVAEGVETQQDLAFLREKRCHQAQGYFIGRPMIGNAFFEWCTMNTPAASTPAQGMNNTGHSQ
ncbi:EAL domain-containing protein [Noviherbaspirillum sp. DKR-6]|uniref:histidine kinase n=1 Tax=Noviherbaspirillum pedocola TaxID=2801341 RepID=A0A934SU86_9BURK|nr:EAL domain-containing protein [Noviherbaspirillum pedocola]